jgi:hypothetical protein
MCVRFGNKNGGTAVFLLDGALINGARNGVGDKESCRYIARGGLSQWNRCGAACSRQCAGRRAARESVQEAARSGGEVLLRHESPYGKSLLDIMEAGDGRQLLMCVTQLVAKLWDAHSLIKKLR